jgi:hypothetical protein
MGRDGNAPLWIRGMVTDNVRRWLETIEIGALDRAERATPEQRKAGLDQLERLLWHLREELDEFRNRGGYS